MIQVDTANEFHSERFIEEHTVVRLSAPASCILAWLILSAAATHADDFAIRDGDTVGFLGDSITAAREYGKHIENYTLLRYPQRTVRFINLGIGGDTAAGGLNRLQRDVFDNNVTLLTVAFGVNDIGWGLKADDEHRQRYLDSIRGIVKACQARGVRVFICSAAVTGGHPDKTENDYLQQMCDDGLAIARAEGAGTIDVQRVMRDILRRVLEANASLPKNKHQTLHTADTVHLNDLGQLAMAYAILEGLGAPSDVSSCVIDAQQQAVVMSEGCNISDISADAEGVAFTRLDEGLPFNNGLFSSLSYRFVPMNQLSRYRLSVRNLPPGQYQLTADGREIGTWPARKLEAGIDISSSTANVWQPGGPWDAQATALKSITDARHKINQAVRHSAAYLTGSPIISPLHDQAREINEQIEQMQRNVAQPQAYRVALTRETETTTMTTPLE